MRLMVVNFTPYRFASATLDSCDVAKPARRPQPTGRGFLVFGVEPCYSRGSNIRPPERRLIPAPVSKVRATHLNSPCILRLWPVIHRNTPVENLWTHFRESYAASLPASASMGTFSARAIRIGVRSVLRGRP
jgi:hypothetical protein